MKYSIIYYTNLFIFQMNHTFIWEPKPNIIFQNLFTIIKVITLKKTSHADDSCRILKYFMSMLYSFAAFIHAMWILFYKATVSLSLCICELSSTLRVTYPSMKRSIKSEYGIYLSREVPSTALQGDVSYIFTGFGGHYFI